MSTILKLPAVVMLAVSLASSPAFAEGSTKPENWVTTWFASPQPTWGSEFVLPTNIPSMLTGQTVREFIKVSAGGKRIRLVFSNRYGKTPLIIGEVRIAMSRDGSSISTKTERLVTFGGHRSVTVPPGAPVMSDPIAFDLAPLSRLGVTSFYPERTPLTTFHWGDQQTALIADGNLTGAPTIEKSVPVKGRLFLSALFVDAPPSTRTVVAFGANLRTDEYGGSLRNRLRFLKQVVEAVVKVAGADRVGVRLAPLTTLQGAVDDTPQATYLAAAKILNDLAVAYIHIAEADWDDAPVMAPAFKEALRLIYTGTIIYSGHYTKDRAIRSDRKRLGRYDWFWSRIYRKPRSATQTQI